MKSIFVFDKPKVEKLQINNEEVKESTKSLYDLIYEIIVKKSDLDFTDDKINKNYNQYYINRNLSMCDLYIPIVNEINKYNFSNKEHYNFFKSVIPRRSQRQYFCYIKKPKDLNATDKKYISDYFDVGLKEANEYIKILTEQQIEDILNVYRYGKGKLADI